MPIWLAALVLAALNLSVDYDVCHVDALHNSAWTAQIQALDL